MAVVAVPAVPDCVSGAGCVPWAGCAFSSSRARFSANWPMSRSLTSATTLRPNWAGLPVMVRSVDTLTSVTPPASVAVAVIWALAVPLPRTSRPAAEATMRWRASSFSAKVTLPW